MVGTAEQYCMTHFPCSFKPKNKTMKKILFALATGLICLSYSCSEQKAAEKDNTAEKRKAANAIFYKAIETGDVSKIDSVLAKDAIDHADMSGNDIVGRDNIKAMFAESGKQINNMKLEVLSSMSDGDYSMDRVRMTGTAAVSIPPNIPVGSKVDITTVEVVKWKDGMAYEHWTYMDTKDVSKMMASAMPDGEKK
jgi:predicted SnoaL-like aldol condensation-catalyzing enzyme